MDVVPKSSQPTGLPPSCGHTVTTSCDGRTTQEKWLAEERIARARRVWSTASGREISDEEAIEILRNVRRLAAVLLEVGGEN